MTELRQPQFGERFQCEGWDVAVTGDEWFVFANRRLTKIYASKPALDDYHRIVFEPTYEEKEWLEHLKSDLRRINSNDAAHAEAVTTEVTAAIKTIGHRKP